MTTTDYPSLDGLLKAATPVEAEPFNLAALLPHERWCAYMVHRKYPDCVEAVDCDCGAYFARDAIARYINTLRVDTENARRIAVALENENAELRDNMPHIEGTSGRCLACGEDWICAGWSQALAVETDHDRLTALQERVTEAVGLLGDALLWCNDGYSNTADSISEAIAALRGEGE